LPAESFGAGRAGEQLARVAEADFVRAHHPVDHAAAGIAAEAVPEIGLRGDDAGRGVIPRVPGTAAGKILALGNEGKALALDEARKTHLALQALQFRIRDARHRVS
jgi:hypothetical protein